MKMKVEVTSEDIRLAKEARSNGGLVNPERVNTCPVAQALKRMGFEKPIVGLLTAAGLGFNSFLPEEASNFIRQADNRQDAVDPISFKMDMPLWPCLTALYRRVFKGVPGPA